MTKLSKQQRERLVLLFLVTSIAALFIWRDVEGQRDLLEDKKRRLADTWQTIHIGSRQSALTNKLHRDLNAAAEVIRRAETNMAAGDVYRWLITRLVELPSANEVELANFEPPEVTETTVLPKVPYQSGLFHVSGSGYYHDIGEFIAEVENTFPHLRVKRLELEAKNSSLSADTAAEPDQEKLLFRLELSGLVRSNSIIPGLSISAIAPSIQRDNR